MSANASGSTGSTGSTLRQPCDAQGVEDTGGPRIIAPLQQLFREGLASRDDLNMFRLTLINSFNGESSEGPTNSQPIRHPYSCFLMYMFLLTQKRAYEAPISIDNIRHQYIKLLSESSLTQRDSCKTDRSSELLDMTLQGSLLLCPSIYSISNDTRSVLRKLIAKPYGIDKKNQVVATARLFGMLKPDYSYVKKYVGSLSKNRARDILKLSADAVYLSMIFDPEVEYTVSPVKPSADAFALVADDVCTASASLQKELSTTQPDDLVSASDSSGIDNIPALLRSQITVVDSVQTKLRNMLPDVSVNVLARLFTGTNRSVLTSLAAEAVDDRNRILCGSFGEPQPKIHAPDSPDTGLFLPQLREHLQNQTTCFHMLFFAAADLFFSYEMEHLMAKPSDEDAIRQLSNSLAVQPAPTVMKILSLLHSNDVHSGISQWAKQDMLTREYCSVFLKTLSLVPTKVFASPCFAKRLSSSNKASNNGHSHLFLVNPVFTRLAARRNFFDFHLSLSSSSTSADRKVTDVIEDCISKALHNYIVGGMFSTLLKHIVKATPSAYMSLDDSLLNPLLMNDFIVAAEATRNGKLNGLDHMVVTDWTPQVLQVASYEQLPFLFPIMDIGSEGSLEDRICSCLHFSLASVFSDLHLLSDCKTVTRLHSHLLPTLTEISAKMSPSSCSSSFLATSCQSFESQFALLTGDIFDLLTFWPNIHECKKHFHTDLKLTSPLLRGLLCYLCLDNVLLSYTLTKVLLCLGALFYSLYVDRFHSGAPTGTPHNPSTLEAAFSPEYILLMKTVIKAIHYHRSFLYSLDAKHNNRPDVTELPEAMFSQLSTNLAASQFNCLLFLSSGIFSSSYADMYCTFYKWCFDHHAELAPHVYSSANIPIYEDAIRTYYPQASFYCMDDALIATCNTFLLMIPLNDKNTEDLSSFKTVPLTSSNITSVVTNWISTSLDLYTDHTGKILATQYEANLLSYFQNGIHTRISTNSPAMMLPLRNTFSYITKRLSSLSDSLIGLTSTLKRSPDQAFLTGHFRLNHIFSFRSYVETLMAQVIARRVVDQLCADAKAYRAAPPKLVSSKNERKCEPKVTVPAAQAQPLQTYTPQDDMAFSSIVDSDFQEQDSTAALASVKPVVCAFSAPTSATLREGSHDDTPILQQPSALSKLQSDTDRCITETDSFLALASATCGDVKSVLSETSQSKNDLFCELFPESFKSIPGNDAIRIALTATNSPLSLSLPHLVSSACSAPDAAHDNMVAIVESPSWMDVRKFITFSAHAATMMIRHHTCEDLPESAFGLLPMSPATLLSELLKYLCPSVSCYAFSSTVTAVPLPQNCSYRLFKGLMLSFECLIHIYCSCLLGSFIRILGNDFPFYVEAIPVPPHVIYRGLLSIRDSLDFMDLSTPELYTLLSSCGLPRDLVAPILQDAVEPTNQSELAHCSLFLIMGWKTSSDFSLIGSSQHFLRGTQCATCKNTLKTWSLSCGHGMCQPHLSTYLTTLLQVQAQLDEDAPLPIVCPLCKTLAYILHPRNVDVSIGQCSSLGRSYMRKRDWVSLTSSSPFDIIAVGDSPYLVRLTNDSIGASYLLYCTTKTEAAKQFNNLHLHKSLDTSQNRFT